LWGEKRKTVVYEQKKNPMWNKGVKCSDWLAGMHMNYPFVKPLVSFKTLGGLRDALSHCTSMLSFAMSIRERIQAVTFVCVTLGPLATIHCQFCSLV
jgi:hypothetical protein